MLIQRSLMDAEHRNIMKVRLLPEIFAQNKVELPFTLHHWVSMEEAKLRIKELRNSNLRNFGLSILSVWLTGDVQTEWGLLTF